jgi:hypothetical protein
MINYNKINYINLKYITNGRRRRSKVQSWKPRKPRRTNTGDERANKDCEHGGRPVFQKANGIQRR